MLLLFICVDCVCQSIAKKVLVIAHRGDHTEAPENTLKAISDAIAHHLNYVEVDLRATKDNQLVIMHDATLDRMTTGKGKVNELTLQDIVKYKVFDKSRSQLGEHKIPLFSEVLDMCKGKMKIYLDFKEADVKSTWELIRSKGMENSLVVYINHINQYKDWRRIAPRVPLMVSLPDSVNSVKSLDYFLNMVDAEFLDGNYTNYTPEMVQHADLKNRKVWLDFQQANEGIEHWKRGVELGIQGFQTDKPRELKAWLTALQP